MLGFKNSINIFSFIFSLLFNGVLAHSPEELKKSRMIQDLEIIKHHFEIGYAPALWKKEYMGWDLDNTFEKYKKEILETPLITTKQFQRIVRRFFNSMADYHVEIQFLSTEMASLPFSVKGVNQRYFINWIDKLRLPASYYAIEVGDELLSFDGRPIHAIIEELKEECPKSNPRTDQAFAEMKLTFRLGMAGDIIPQGNIIIQTQSPLGNKSSYQLKWSYTSESIKNPIDFLQSLNYLWKYSPVKTRNRLPQILMANPLHQIYAEKCGNRSGGLGARKSFLPLLGNPIWTYEDSTDKENKNEISIENLLGSEIKWHAYTYSHPQGYSIGYIRIPHYMAFSDSAKKFGKIIKYMQDHTDALVIDQLHNFGGFVSFQYEIASMLTTTPLITPYHRIKITQKEVMEAYQALEFIKTLEIGFQAQLEEENSETESSKNQNVEGVNYQQLLFFKTYYELILDEWNAGHMLTKATPILGVDMLNPHARYRYTKPILMLINEMNFSGGDFMPAILQDNKQAILFGARTAGAGGFVHRFEFPNCHGLAACSYTASIAERPSLQKIENLGVTPDIEYQITVEDVKEGYQGYIHAVNEALQAMLEK